MNDPGVTQLQAMIRTATRVYVLGNGGSYANASHVVNDLLAAGVRAYTIDPATLSAFANDHGWFNALARWVDIVIEPGDLLTAFSGSGTSQNILRAIEAAEHHEAKVWREFGEPQDLTMQAAEERQLWLGHQVARWGVA